jgi:hypothetical protein
MRQTKVLFTLCICWEWMACSRSRADRLLSLPQSGSKELVIRLADLSR